MNSAGVLLRSGAPRDLVVARRREALRFRQLLSPSAWAKWQEEKAAILIPGGKIDYSQVTAIRIALRQRLQDAVGRTMGQTTIIRDLSAYDVSGIASGSNGYARLSNHSALTAHTWFTNDFAAFLRVPINTGLGIYGYEQLAAVPNIDAIAFTLGGNVTIAQFWLDAIYSDQYQSIGYFDPPVVFSPQQLLGINLLASAAVSANAEAYGLLGYTCEPAGNTVAPDQSNLV